MGVHDQPEYVIRCSSFVLKPSPLQQRILEVLSILSDSGWSVPKTPRARERAALLIMALGDIGAESPWMAVKSVEDGQSLGTREVLKYWNDHYGERMSSASYDDVKRQDIDSLMPFGFVVLATSSAKYNDGTRGYALSTDFVDVLRTYGTQDWPKSLTKIKQYVQQFLTKERVLEQFSVTLPGNLKIIFPEDEHNRLQAALIEKFLLYFGHGAEVLYVGTPENRLLHVAGERLTEIGLPLPGHEILPDVIAYSPLNNWVYLMEAYFSSGPISDNRKREFKKLLEKCTAEAIFVTAFPNLNVMKAHIHELAWEQEIWLADKPDHLIHFNGDKFLGPHR